MGEGFCGRGSTRGHRHATCGLPRWSGKTFSSRMAKWSSIGCQGGSLELNGRSAVMRGSALHGNSARKVPDSTPVYRAGEAAQPLHCLIVPWRSLDGSFWHHRELPRFLPKVRRRTLYDRIGPLRGQTATR